MLNMSIPQPSICLSRTPSARTHAPALTLLLCALDGRVGTRRWPLCLHSAAHSPGPCPTGSLISTMTSNRLHGGRMQNLPQPQPLLLLCRRQASSTACTSRTLNPLLIPWCAASTRPRLFEQSSKTSRVDCARDNLLCNLPTCCAASHKNKHHVFTDAFSVLCLDEAGSFHMRLCQSSRAQQQRSPSSRLCFCILCRYVNQQRLDDIAYC